MATSYSSGGGSGGTTTTTTTALIPTDLVFPGTAGKLLVPIEKWNEWSKVRLNGELINALATVQVSGQERKIDVKDAANKGSAKITLKGYSPSSVEITLKIWTIEQWQDWQKIYPQFAVNNAANTTSATSIYHPACAAQNISSIVIKKISGIEVSEGLITIKIDAIENSSVKDTGSGNAKGSGKGGGGSSRGKDYDDLVDAYIFMATTCAKSKTPYGDWRSYCIGSGKPEYATQPFPEYYKYDPFNIKK